ncbi:hypothetical protein [Aestuariibaculum lutulentum]|uniref:Uncharacterized protein n=1 Tax=Aestuariibaculum lutulentum TaxID=2920935 RepID=A0ABS9RK44_9FLAO|nr:hypothetical protein [Aestuariibaculum lutulentum]MCH4553335.1 hypothetical protein [Aestuariibaculum lutulentum]
MLKSTNEQAQLFEKVVFLELTNKQFSKFHDSEYYAAYNLLNQNFKELIDYKIS